MSKNEELARKVRGLVYKQDLDATMGRMWTVDEFVEAVVADAIEAQEARIEDLEAELARKDRMARKYADSLVREVHNVEEQRTRAERAEQERDAAHAIIAELLGTAAPQSKRDTLAEHDAKVIDSLTMSLIANNVVSGDGEREAVVFLRRCASALRRGGEE